MIVGRATLTIVASMMISETPAESVTSAPQGGRSAGGMTGFSPSPASLTGSRRTARAPRPAPAARRPARVLRARPRSRRPCPRRERAVAHARGHALVRLAEGDALLHERLGGVGREDERVGGRGGHALAVDLQPGDERRQRLQPEPRVLARREDGRLVLLQVAVVGERQPLDGGEEAGQPPDRGARLAAGELGHVRVQLLRHHRRACRGALGQLREAELAGRPEHELLADAREVRVEDGDGVEVVEREVAVGDGVDRVAHLAGRARQAERRARERAGAERALDRRGGRGGEARAVAVEHLHPGQQVVAERHGLAALQMRVAGQQRVGLGLGERQHDERERVDLLAAPRRTRRAT